MDDFLLEIQNTFFEEAQQILDDWEQSLLLLEGGDQSTELINKIFRLAHNFKGSSKSVGFTNMSELAHRCEDVLTKIKQGQISPEPVVLTTLLKSVDFLRLEIRELMVNRDFRGDSSTLKAKLVEIFSGEQKISGGKETPMDEGFGIFEESQQNFAKTEMPAKKSLAASNVTSIVKKKPGSGEEEAIRVPSERLDQLLNLVGELVVNQAIIKDLKKDKEISFEKIDQSLDYMRKLIDDVQNIAMSLRLVPIKPLVQKLQRSVRDLGNEVGKNIIFESVGDHVEIDKNILNRITDPLTHMVRNSVDHGIESPEERKKNGKPERATIRVEALEQSDRIIIKVSDDGKGLNKERILKKAIANGLISGREQLSDEQIHALIFKPGFSTKEQVTEISGRGVGMEVVEKAVEALKGTISIASTEGKGTEFSLSLPLSLSIIGGLIVTITGKRFIIPISQLTETVELRKHKIETSTNKGRMINLRGEIMPIISLSQALKSELKGTERAGLGTAVITTHRGRKISFEVEDIIGEQQIVLKQLGKEFEGLPGILGGAILSNGEPGIVLNLHELIPMEVYHAA